MGIIEGFKQACEQAAMTPLTTADSLRSNSGQLSVA
jgi:hypothetical protein